MEGWFSKWMDSNPLKCGFMAENLRYRRRRGPPTKMFWDRQGSGDIDYDKKEENGIFGTHHVQYKIWIATENYTEEKIEGRRGVRRKKLSWLCNIRQWTELRTVKELIYTARNREKMQNVIINHPLNKHTKKKTHIQDVQRNDPHDFLDTSNN